MHLHTILGSVRFGSVRFGSVRIESESVTEM